ncbi:cytochrome P450 [Mycena sanguinolenta]|nr:cytochrome P450 [Mycena sanguinolenta]
MNLHLPEFTSSLGEKSVLVIVVAVALCYYHARTTKTPHVPPSPRGLPFVGNVFDIPTQDPHIKFAELGDIYGDIFSLSVLGKTLIVIHSAKVAEDLLDVQGANFAGRPTIAMGELSGFNNVLPLINDSERVRTERKLLHQVLGTHAAVEKFLPLIASEIHKLLVHIASNPDDFIKHICQSRSVRASHMEDGDNDPMLTMFETMANNIESLIMPATFLMEVIPALRYWPEWLPGGGFQTKAKICSKQAHDTADMGLQYVKEQMAAGTAESCFLSAILEKTSHEDSLLKWVAIAIGAGGIDTITGQLEAFFLAMCLNPDVQAAAQHEIDTVVGHDRLPDISDREQLPYLNALCKELFRWHIVAPLGMVHRTRDDMIYDRGGDLQPVLIPKDSLVIANLWQMTHDPAHYANPMDFDPTRFLQSNHNGKEPEPDPTNICFGFGRRICPGKLLGEKAVFMACCAILSVFNISKVCENGAVIEPEVGQSHGIVSRVLPFKCVVVPRNERANALLHRD